MHNDDLSPRDSDSDNEMGNKIQMKGLSLKDALDLIPRFNNENIPVSQFLNGCEEALTIVPEEFDHELAKLIRMRLYGDALNAARAEKFTNMKQIAEFFEKTFGSVKTYFDLTGELAKVRQKQNEAIIVYANRLKEIENAMIKAARREGCIKDETAFQKEFERDCLKFFIKGLRWEIKAMGEAKNCKEAQKLAIDTEREYACSMAPPQQRGEKNESNKKKDIRRMNIVNPVRPPIICAYCEKPDHGAINCFALARARHTSGQGKNLQGSYDRPRYFPQHAKMQFGGWNAENRRRVEFLPASKGPNSVGDFRNRGNSFPRNGTGNSSNHANSQRNNSNFSNSNNTPSKREVVCFFCNKKGHVTRDCFKFKAE